MSLDRLTGLIAFAASARWAAMQRCGRCRSPPRRSAGASSDSSSARVSLFTPHDPRAGVTPESRHRHPPQPNSRTAQPSMRRHIDRLFRHQRLTKVARRHSTSRSSASPAARRVAGTSCWPALRRSPAGVAKVQQLGGDRHTQLQADPQQRLFLSGGRLRVERHRHGNRQIVLGVVAVFAATEKAALAALPARKARACARLKRRNRTPGSAFGVLLDVTDDASIDARRLRPRRHSRGIAAGEAAPPVRRQTVRRGGADRGRATGMRQRRSGRIINITSMGGFITMPDIAYYCRSRFVLEGIPEMLASDFRAFGLTLPR